MAHLRRELPDVYPRFAIHTQLERLPFGLDVLCKSAVATIQALVGSVELNSDDVVISSVRPQSQQLSVSLHFVSRKVSATILCAVYAPQTQNWVDMCGTQGSLRAHNLCWPLQVSAAADAAFEEIRVQFFPLPVVEHEEPAPIAPAQTSAPTPTAQLSVVVSPASAVRPPLSAAISSATSASLASTTASTPASTTPSTPASTTVVASTSTTAISTTNATTSAPSASLTSTTASTPVSTTTSTPASTTASTPASITSPSPTAPAARSSRASERRWQGETYTLPEVELVGGPSAGEVIAELFESVCAVAQSRDPLLAVGPHWMQRAVDVQLLTHRILKQL
jgi:hypothetical protein